MASTSFEYYSGLKFYPLENCYFVIFSLISRDIFQISWNKDNITRQECSKQILTPVLYTVGLQGTFWNIILLFRPIWQLRVKKNKVVNTPILKLAMLKIQKFCRKFVEKIKNRRKNLSQKFVAKNSSQKFVHTVGIHTLGIHSLGIHIP